MHVACASVGRRESEGKGHGKYRASYDIIGTGAFILSVVRGGTLSRGVT